MRMVGGERVKSCHGFGHRFVHDSKHFSILLNHTRLTGLALIFHSVISLNLTQSSLFVFDVGRPFKAGVPGSSPGRLTNFLLITRRNDP